VLQYQLRVNETLISSVTFLMASACPPGVPIYSDIKLRLKLLTTALTSASCLDLSVSFAIHLTSDCSVQTFQQHLHGANVEVIDGVLSTPTDARSSPYYFTQVFALRGNYQAANLVTNFPIIFNRAVFQREIIKTIQNVANSTAGTRARRVAISNADTHGGRAHCIVVCFDITKPF
jgi:hypothetical protein